MRGLPGEGSPLWRANRPCFLPGPFPDGHTGSDRASLSGWLGPFSAMVGPSENGLERAAPVLDRATASPKTLRCRDSYRQTPSSDEQRVHKAPTHCKRGFSDICRAVKFVASGRPRCPMGTVGKRMDVLGHSQSEIRPGSSQRRRNAPRGGQIEPHPGARWHEITVGGSFSGIPQVQASSKSDKPQVRDLPPHQSHIRILTKTATNRNFR